MGLLVHGLDECRRRYILRTQLREVFLLPRTQVSYLSYIVAAQNIPSILQRGILSHNLAEVVPHTSVADRDVQDLRSRVALPNGRSLHDYANLYFWARNAMMYRLRHDENLCVLKVSRRVLDLPGAYYSTQNCSTLGVAFHPCNGDFEHLSYDTLYAGSWSRDGVTDNALKQRMQAEVLIPEVVPPQYIEGVFYHAPDHARRIGRFTGNLDLIERGGLFFV